MAKVIASVRVESERPLSLSRTAAAQTYQAAMGKSFASAGDSFGGHGGSFASAVVPMGPFQALQNEMRQFEAA
eukprot:4277502-Lingulodinium_polyedra.AAC.1